MKRTIITAAIPVGMMILSSGCAGPQLAKQLNTMDERVVAQEKMIKDHEKRQEGQRTRLEKQEKRLAAQERDNELLKRELAATKRGLGAAIEGKVKEAMRQPGVQAAIQKTVEQNVARRMEERDQRRRDGGAERWENMRAQFETRRREREKQELKKLADDLGMNEDQQKQVNNHVAELRETAEDAFKKMREGGGFDLEAAKVAVDDMKRRNDAVMKDVLTAEQYEEYEKRPNPLDNIQKLLAGGGGQWGEWGRGQRGRGRGRNHEREREPDPDREDQ